VDNERKATTTMPLKERFEAAVVVCVPVRYHERAQVSDRNLQHIEVAGKRARRQPAVIEQRTALPVALDSDQRRETVFGDQLVTIAEVCGEIPAHTLDLGHQQIDEVVDNDRHLHTIYRFEDSRKRLVHTGHSRPWSAVIPEHWPRSPSLIVGRWSWPRSRIFRRKQKTAPAGGPSGPRRPTVVV
jgi:hypothetical protein